MRLLIDFLRFLWHSKNEHRIHSPFVFRLYLDVICGKNTLNPPIEKLRKELLKNNSRIDTTNPGAGSKVHDTHHHVSKVAKSSLKSPAQAALLSRLVDHFQPQHILEIGTSFGITTAYLAQTGAHVVTLEGAPVVAKIAQRHFNQLGLSNIHLKEGDFKDTLPKHLDSIQHVDIVFFDGNHQYKPTMDYFHQCKSKAVDGTVFIFDDIYWSDGMKRAWQEIIADKDVNVSIDLFHLGLVLFKKGQKKEHFMLRYWP